MDLSALFTGLAMNLTVISVLVFGCYRRRHSKVDLMLSYIVLNIGVFGAVALLAGADGGLALGMGLFGILSIIRLRSSAISQTEVAYYFVALVLGLVNSLGAHVLPLAITINVLLVGALWALDRESGRSSAAPRRPAGSPWTWCTTIRTRCAPTCTAACARRRWR